MTSLLRRLPWKITGASRNPYWSVGQDSGNKLLSLTTAHSTFDGTIRNWTNNFITNWYQLGFLGSIEKTQIKKPLLCPLKSIPTTPINQIRWLFPIFDACTDWWKLERKNCAYKKETCDTTGIVSRLQLFPDDICRLEIKLDPWLPYARIYLLSCVPLFPRNIHRIKMLKVVTIRFWPGSWLN